MNQDGRIRSEERVRDFTGEDEGGFFCHGLLGGLGGTRWTHSRLPE